MAKFAFFAILLVSIAFFGSCSNSMHESRSDVPQPSLQPQTPKGQKAYGSYLAGRVAHLRRDFNTASDYYMKALKLDPENKELAGKIYLLLVSKGRIDEAARYAQQYINDGNDDNFAYVVVATKQMHEQQYQESIKTLDKLKNPAYREFIAPLLNAWNYAGLKQPDKALQQLKKLEKEPGFKSIYHFHAGMVNDYFGRNREAQKHYEVIVNEESLEMSMRSLQIISNFYIRTGQKDKALALFEGYGNEKILTDMLQNIKENINNAQEKKLRPLITSPDMGASEALFSIAATFRYDEVIDVAHMFTSLAIYQNPDYDLAKLLLADILESREMYADANEVYESISKNSDVYYAVQLKKANNFIKMNDYDSAELLLKSLALDYDNAQIYLDLGDVLRMKNRHEEAIKYYKQAIKHYKNDSNVWVLYYALGVSFEQNGQWDQAEKELKKALKLSNNHYLVLNYLGYTWIKQGTNVNDAFAMIVSAYNQAPNDANISDSLGWALYNLGYYGMAVGYIEKAAEAAPSNAVISDHLGDVYWFNQRKNEARFQWKHALTMKDDSGELNRKQIQAKLKDGIPNEPSLVYDKDIIEKQIRLISRQ